jgi:hypothetical protein
MRAREFINEVLDMAAPPPPTTWISDIDSEGKKVDVGQWKDTTGRDVKNVFQKDDQGTVKIDFDRTNAKGEPTYALTHGGKGKQAAIISGVTQNIKDYMIKNPDVGDYKFTSSDASRTRLYNRMVDRLAPEMGLVGSATYNPDLERTEYQLRKAQPGEVHKQLATPRPPRPAAEPKTTSGPPVSLQRPAGYKQPAAPLSTKSLNIQGPAGGSSNNKNDMAMPDYSMGLDPSYSLTQMKADQMNKMLKKSY